MMRLVVLVRSDPDTIAPPLLASRRTPAKGHSQDNIIFYTTTRRFSQ